MLPAVGAVNQVDPVGGLDGRRGMVGARSRWARSRSASGRRGYPLSGGQQSPV